MRIIKTNKGQKILVDDEDFDNLKDFTWYINSGGYAIRDEWRRGKKKGVLMHRNILSIAPGFFCDHKNRNPLDNRRKNLRIATAAQNQANRGKQKNNTSGYLGVCWLKHANKWMAYLNKKGKFHYIGRFNDRIEAARARDTYAKKMHGQFAGLNFPQDGDLFA